MSEIREALTAAGASPFVPKLIDPTLVEYQRRFAPWCRSVPTKKHNSTTYFFNTRTVVVSGGAVPDGGARPVSTSTYTQGQFNMTHIQAVGSVTGYAQAVTQDLIDLRATEVNGAIKGYYWDTECFMGWGNSASTANGAQPQFDGFDTQIAQFSQGGSQNVIDYAGKSLSLATLDELIVMVSGNAAEPVADPSWMFVMSVSAEARIAQLLTAQQRFDSVEIAAGLIVATYKRIPLVPTSFLSTLGYQVGTVTAATATTGGTLAAATYYYKVSAVIARQGEILPSAEVSQATTGSTSTVTLSFTAPTGQDGLGTQLYKVWRGTVGGRRDVPRLRRLHGRPAVRRGDAGLRQPDRGHRYRPGAAAVLGAGRARHPADGVLRHELRDAAPGGWPGEHLPAVPRPGEHRAAIRARGGSFGCVPDDFVPGQNAVRHHG